MRSARTFSSGKARSYYRNPFPDAHFFIVPLRLYESGLAARMSGSEFKRYVSLLRLANYSYGSREVQVDLKSLETLDGVSPRRAWFVHLKLEERGLIQVKKTRPATYELVHPDCWPECTGEQPRLQRVNSSLRVENELPQAESRAPTYEEVFGRK